MDKISINAIVKKCSSSCKTPDLGTNWFFGILGAAPKVTREGSLIQRWKQPGRSGSPWGRQVYIDV